MIDFFGSKANRELLTWKAHCVRQDIKIREQSKTITSLENQIKVLESMLDKSSYTAIDYPNTSTKKGGI